MQATDTRAEATEEWVSTLCAEVEQQEEMLVNLRCQLHRHPELSNEEKWTTETLLKRLQQSGVQAERFSHITGLYATVRSSPASDVTVGLRGDIDGLPIHDEKQSEYRSRVEGVMHACGHDAHATIVLGAMIVLQRLVDMGKNPWPISIKGIFQPAEEASTGALDVIETGVCENIDTIFALHVDPTLPTGNIGLRTGVLTAGCDKFSVRFTGKGGHGARPYQTTDPVDAATAWVQMAYSRIGRRVDPFDPTSFSVGKIVGGHAANVIPTSVEIAGTLRTTSTAGRARTLGVLEQTSEAIRITSGCDVELETHATAVPVNNNPVAIELLSQATRLLLGRQAEVGIPHPSLGSEDFSYYQQRIPGALARLGIAGHGVGNQPLHTSRFDIDPHALVIGTRLLAATAILGCKPSWT